MALLSSMWKGERERERKISCERQYQTLAIVKCRRVSAHLALRTILVQAYTTTNNKHTGPKKSTMPECPPSGIHRRFHEKPSTSIESQETRKLKSAQSVLAYEKRPKISKMKSAIVKYRRKMDVSEVRSGVLKCMDARAHGLKASSASSQIVN